MKKIAILLMLIFSLIIFSNPVFAATCGNNILESGEQCDDGNNNNFDECRNDCTLPFCGDAISDQNRGEECDDGNGLNGGLFQWHQWKTGGGGPYFCESNGSGGRLLFYSGNCLWN